MEFHPFAFVTSLAYMGRGMLGVGLVILIIAVATTVLSKVTRKKQ